MKLSAITIELPSGEKLLGAVDMETGDTYTLKYSSSSFFSIL